MAIKNIEDIVRQSGITDEAKLRELQEGLKALDANNDDKIETKEVIGDEGYLKCEGTVNTWQFDKLDNIQNALFKAGLIGKLRDKICQPPDGNSPFPFSTRIINSSAFNSREVEEECQKTLDTTDPKTTPIKECTSSTLFGGWPNLKPSDLTSGPPVLLQKLKEGMSYIEKNGYGKVDTFGEGGPCNTFHAHLLADRWFIDARYPSGGFEADRVVDLAQKNTGDFALLYHTEEATERFPDYSANRNIIQRLDGKIYNHGSPTCMGIMPIDINMRDIKTYYFAIVKPAHPLYQYGHPLADGRRFIVWPSRG